MSSQPNQRISTFRSNIKKVSDAHVVAFYGLQPGQACAAKVDWLLDNLRYIYPHNFEKATTDWKQPFRNPVIPSIMHAAYWTGASAVGLREQDSNIVFASCRHDRPSEQEVPIPMVALVGSVVRPLLCLIAILVTR